MITSHDGAAVCSAKRHGTASAYQHVKCKCPEARTAQRLYVKRRKTGNPEVRRVDATATVRMIHALMALGHNADTIGKAAGVTRQRVTETSRCQTWVTPRTATVYRAAYDRLSMMPGMSNVTRARAAAAGWAPPLAWDDDTIGDPNAQPCITATERDDLEPDHAVVLRAVTGERGIATRPVDRLAVASRMRAKGVRDSVTAEVLGIKVDSLQRLMYRNDLVGQKAAA